jgi:hypothetical protein
MIESRLTTGTRIIDLFSVILPGVVTIQRGQSRASFDWSKPRATWQDLIIRELEAFQPSVVMIGYGMASSLEGPQNLGQFKTDMNRLLDRIQESSKKKNSVRLVLFSPVRHEAMGGALPDPTAHNRILKSYTSSIASIAKQRAFHSLIYSTALAMGIRMPLNGRLPTTVFILMLMVIQGLRIMFNQ